MWRQRSEKANPGGVELADAHVRMFGEVIKHILPRRLRPLVPRPVAQLVPRIYMRFVIGDTGCARIGVRPVTLFFALKWLLFNAPHVWARLWHGVNSKFHVRLSEWFLQHLVNMMYEKPPGFIIPSDVEDLRNLVEEGWKD